MRKSARFGKIALLVALCFCFLLICSACVPGDGTSTTEKPAGFFWGVWHGWVAPISLIIGLFNKSIRVYETANTGWWYDLGYYLAIAGGFGGIAFFRGRKK